MLRSNPFQTAVTIDAEGTFLGLVYQDQLGEYEPDSPLASIGFTQNLEFDESTSLWDALEAMRDFIGEAVPVIDSTTGRYLGSVPESEVISTFLDAIHDLRREEHEA